MAQSNESIVFQSLLLSYKLVDVKVGEGFLWFDEEAGESSVCCGEWVVVIMQLLEHYYSCDTIPITTSDLYIITLIGKYILLLSIDTEQ